MAKRGGKASETHSSPSSDVSLSKALNPSTSSRVNGCNWAAALQRFCVTMGVLAGGELEVKGNVFSVYLHRFCLGVNVSLG